MSYFKIFKLLLLETASSQFSGDVPHDDARCRDDAPLRLHDARQHDIHDDLHLYSLYRSHDHSRDHSTHDPILNEAPTNVPIPSRVPNHIPNPVGHTVLQPAGVVAGAAVPILN